MNIRFLFSFLFCCLPYFLIFGQELDTNDDDQFEYDESQSDVDLDLSDTIRLKESVTYAVRFNSDLEKRYFYWLRKRVRDVWPYVLEATKEYYFVQDSANLIENKRERKRFIKARNELLAENFSESLKKLSTSRGQVLTKLIHRETNRTAHQIIRELRGGLKAFLWSTAGKAFDIDLKVEFDPRKTREDLYLEVILQQEFSKGRLQQSSDYIAESE